MPAANSMRMQQSVRVAASEGGEGERGRGKEMNVYGWPEWFGFYTVHCSLDWNLYVLTMSCAMSGPQANKQSQIERERERGSCISPNQQILLSNLW